MTQIQTTRRQFGLATLACLVGGTATAAGIARPPIVLGTATTGGGFPVYGAAFAVAVAQGDPELAIETRSTMGSTENVPLLKAGRLDLGLCTGEVARDTMDGPEGAGLRILAAMYASPGLFAVRRDGPLRSIADLRGRAVAFGARGSGLVLLARLVLGGLGLDLDRDFQAIYLDQAADGPVMVADGRAVALWGAGFAWPGFTAIARAASGARLIAPNPGEVRAILAAHAGLAALTVPAATYPGQDEDLFTVGSWSVVLTRPGLDDDTAYRVSRALHRAEGGADPALAGARESTAVNTLAAAGPERLHPGVARYYREIGLLR